MPGRYFAYGKDTVGDCECPAVAAGMTVSQSNNTVSIAGEYDRIVTQESSCGRFDEGTINENHAREAWFKAIKELKKIWPDGHERIEVAEQIAAELGWENDST